MFENRIGKNTPAGGDRGKKSIQKTAEILLPLLIYFAVHDVVQVILTLIFTRCIVRTGAPYMWFISHAETANTVIWAVALVIAAAAVIPFIRKDGCLSYDYAMHGVLGSLRSPEQWCVLVIMTCSAALGLNMLLQLTGIARRSEEYSQTILRQYGIAFGLGIALYGILSPVIEEMIFRGLVYNRMKRYFPVRLSIAVSALLFGVYHQNAVQGIYGFIMGLLIAWAYEYFDSFTAPVLVHVTANCLIYGLSYFRIIDRLCSVAACTVSLLIAAACLYVLTKTAGQPE